MTDDEELEKLREQRKRELQEGEREAQEEAAERQKKQLWQKAKEYMTEDAAERLSNIRTVNEQKAYSVAQQIVALAQSGQIRDVDEDQMKDILRQIQKDQEENQSNIKFRKG